MTKKTLLFSVLLVTSIFITTMFIHFNAGFFAERSAVSVTLDPDNEADRYSELWKFLQSETNVSTTKTILFWDKFYNSSLFTLHEEAFRSGYLKSIQCPVTNCIFTSNRSYFSDPREYEAIVFHAAQPGFSLKDIPSARDPRQIYIMATKECPAQMGHNLMMDDPNFYNFTMTYRLDSDISWNYGKITDLLTLTKIAPAIDVRWRKPDVKFKDSILLEQAKNKTKTATLFVSHCGAYSKRDELVRKLQEYIDVEVYGKCGTKTCGARHSKECANLLDKTYSFYFAFENTLCLDYITEKVYEPMEQFIIPVIYSGADLSRFLPPHSYIDVENFKTAKELASFLTDLSNNPEEYVKYFWWRKHYKIVKVHSIDACEICQKLNRHKLSSKTQIYSNIQDWYYKDACRDPKIEF